MQKLLIATLLSLFTFPVFAQLGGSELDGENTAIWVVYHLNNLMKLIIPKCT